LEQKRLDGGTVQDYERGERMFRMLAELFSKPKPIIGHPAWKDSITAEQKARIQVERLKQIKESNGEKITEATDYEALVYVMTVSFAMPLNTTWFNIYTFLFRKFHPEQANQIFESHEGQKLDEFIEQRDLTRLKQWLWKQQNKR